jgi:hypothetical protein
MCDVFWMYGNRGLDHVVLVDPVFVPVGEIVGALCGVLLEARPGRPGVQHQVCAMAAAAHRLMGAVA